MDLCVSHKIGSKAESDQKTSLADQRLMWDDLRKRINGLVMNVSVYNIRDVAKELLSQNLLWGRGLFCRAILKSSMASPNLTPVFAALVAVVNSKFPDIGYLLLKRTLNQLRMACKRNDKVQLLPLVKLLAQLVNQRVVHDLVALELLFLLLQVPTNERIEVAVVFVLQCGSVLHEFTPRRLHSVFERFREVTDGGDVDNCTQGFVDNLFAIRRKLNFSGFPSVTPELDIVDEDDQVSHKISLMHSLDPEMFLDVFRPNSNFLSNEDQSNLPENVLLDFDAAASYTWW